MDFIKKRNFIKNKIKEINNDLLNIPDNTKKYFETETKISKLFIELKINNKKMTDFVRNKNYTDEEIDKIYDDFQDNNYNSIKTNYYINLYGIFI